MDDPQRQLLVVADDKDVAEVAAFGLRMYEGWQPVIATSPAEAIEIAHKWHIDGIAIIVVQPSARVPRNIVKLLSLSQEICVPLFGITPDPTVSEQFQLLGVNVYCTPFDPIHMWTQVPQTAGHAQGH
jgi:CheY-like chemotaxis protein